MENEGPLWDVRSRKARGNIKKGDGSLWWKHSSRGEVGVAENRRVGGNGGGVVGVARGARVSETSCLGTSAAVLACPFFSELGKSFQDFSTE